jgi:prepilin-type N-terminal cleavage/methylation domain-containing protein
MRMRLTKRTQPGMTLIELLVVIAIIAVITAILFPVFSRARVGVAQGQCIANMNKLYTAASLYDQDYGGYPALLFGYAQDANGDPAASNPIPMHSAKRTFLNGLYIKNADVFHCPASVNRNDTVVINAAFPANSGRTGAATFGTHGFRGRTVTGFDFDAQQNTPLPLYLFDSYDTSSIIGQRDQYQVVYSRDWTGLFGRNDATNQLKYQDPPADRTVITWCNFHATVSGAEQVPVLLASGSATPVQKNKVTERTWNVANGQ